MNDQDKLNLVTNWFAEDWAIEKAMKLLEDYDKAQQPSLTPQANSQHAPLHESVLEDALRYRWLVAHCRSTSEHWGGRWSIVVDGPTPELENGEYLIDEAIDAARKQGTSHD